MRRLLAFLAAIATAVPLGVSAVAVSDEAGLRAAIDSSVSEVVVTANVSLTAGQLEVSPGRNLTLRGACGGAANASPCTVDANSLSRHLHVMPGAEVRVSNLIFINGAAVSTACSPFSQTYIAGSAAGCRPEYFGYGVALGLLDTFPGLSGALNNPTIGDLVSPRSIPSHFLSNCAQQSVLLL